MQTTLLGFAIAIILALVAALVGPIFIDWGRYRGEFEARASRLTGLDFRVTGAIDARLLPTPTLMLQGVEFGRPNEGSKVRARALRIEFALGALVRGAWRIADARLEGPELTAGLDPTGHLSWPVPKLGFDLETVAIERLNIEDGRAVLVDDASNSRLVLDKMEFHGELRSLAGPIKGDGSFVVAGQRYPYSVSTSRIADDGSVKVRLAVNPVDLPLTSEADLTILIERGTPRFEGSIQVARAVGRAPAGADSVMLSMICIVCGFTVIRIDCGTFVGSGHCSSALGPSTLHPAWRYSDFTTMVPSGRALMPLYEVLAALSVRVVS